MNILITNVFGDYNAGDRLLFDTLVQEIKKTGNHNISSIARYHNLLKQKHPDIEFITQPTKIENKNKFLKFLQYTYIHLALFLNLRLEKIFSFLLNRKLSKIIDNYKNSDIVISSAGGFLEDSNNSYYVNLAQIYFALILNKKIIIAPQSIGPIESKFGQNILKYILSKCYKVYVRESYSLKFCKNLGLENIYYSTDLAFFYENTFNKVNQKESVHYSTVINWTFPGLDKEEYRLKYINAMKQYYRFIHESYNKKTIILNQVESDIELANKIVNGCEEFVSIDYNIYSADEMISKINESEIFTGSRFHSCIFSILSNTPCIAIAYLPKTTEIMEDMNLSKYVININDITEEKLIAIYDNIHSNIEKTKKEFLNGWEKIKSENEFINELCLSLKVVK